MVVLEADSVRGVGIATDLTLSSTSLIIEWNVSSYSSSDLKLRHLDILKLKKWI